MTVFVQVLCPRCEVGQASSPKRKAKKGKESPKSNKKKTRINSLSDVEKVLSETKDSTSTVSNAGMGLTTGKCPHSGV